MTRAEQAAKLFYDGYNCAQAVTLAFADEMGLSEEFAAKMACSFGGGMGRLREVCGAVSGMLLVAGLLYGYTEDVDGAKMRHYKLVQELAGKFREKNGSIICREILNNPPLRPGAQSPDRGILRNPSLRTNGLQRRQHSGRLYFCQSIQERQLTN